MILVSIVWVGVSVEKELRSVTGFAELATAVAVTV
jgi:hypothetical protein